MLNSNIWQIGYERRCRLLRLKVTKRFLFGKYLIVYHLGHCVIGKKTLLAPSWSVMRDFVSVEGKKFHTFEIKITVLDLEWSLLGIPTTRQDYLQFKGQKISDQRFRIGSWNSLIDGFVKSVVRLPAYWFVVTWLTDQPFGKTKDDCAFLTDS